MMSPRYPELHVQLRSDHPLALVSAVRQEMRRRGVEPREISRFSAEALGAGADQEVRRVCAAWADIDILS